VSTARVPSSRSATDRRVRGITSAMRLVGVTTTGAVDRAARVHGAFAVACAAMGRLMSAAALLGTDLKAGGYVRLTTDGGGPLGRVRAEAHADGLLRARVDGPHVDLPPTPAGKLAVGQAVGRDGTLTVDRIDADGRVYTSQSPLESGEIGEDVARFLLQSEQIRSAVALGVLVNADGSVAAAGGILVQALPAAPPDQVAAAASRVERLTDLSWRLAEGADVSDLLAQLVDEPVTWAEPERLHWGCRCSRVESLALLGAVPWEDRRRWALEGGAEVVCHYCRTAYRFGADEVAGEGEATRTPRS
jgi:molecular chaperone Hsp33